MASSVVASRSSIGSPVAGAWISMRSGRPGEITGMAKASLRSWTRASGDPVLSRSSTEEPSLSRSSVERGDRISSPLELVLLKALYWSGCAAVGSRASSRSSDSIQSFHPSPATRSAGSVNVAFAGASASPSVAVAGKVSKRGLSPGPGSASMSTSVAVRSWMDRAWPSIPSRVAVTWISLFSSNLNWRPSSFSAGTRAGRKVNTAR